MDNIDHVAFFLSVAVGDCERNKGWGQIVPLVLRFREFSCWIYQKMKAIAQSQQSETEHKGKGTETARRNREQSQPNYTCEGLTNVKWGHLPACRWNDNVTEAQSFSKLGFLWLEGPECIGGMGSLQEWGSGHFSLGRSCCLGGWKAMQKARLALWTAGQESLRGQALFTVWDFQWFPFRPPTRDLPHQKLQSPWVVLFILFPLFFLHPPHSSLFIVGQAFQKIFLDNILWLEGMQKPRVNVRGGGDTTDAT